MLFMFFPLYFGQVCLHTCPLTPLSPTKNLRQPGVLTPGWLAWEIDAGKLVSVFCLFKPFGLQENLRIGVAPVAGGHGGGVVGI